MCHAKSDCKAPAYAKSCTRAAFTYSLVNPISQMITINRTVRPQLMPSLAQVQYLHTVLSAYLSQSANTCK